MEEIDQHLIERYLANDLSETERADFLRRRKEDAVFNQAVEDYEYAKEALIIKERDALRARIKGWDQDLDSGQQDVLKPKKFNFFWLAIAAIVVLGLLLWWFMFTPDHPSMPVNENKKDSLQTNTPYISDSTSIPKEKPQDKNKKEEKPPMADALKKGGELFAENFKPFKNDAMTPVSRGNDLSPVEQFRKYYWEGQYREAMITFSRLGQEYQNNDNMRFVYAMALMANANDHVAQLELENIIRHGKSIYLEEATWYLGLLYLKQGDMTKAKTYFQKCVKSPQGYNKIDAGKILEKMK